MRTKAALLLILPAFVLYIYSFAVPLVMVGKLSLFNIEAGRSVFVGFANYVRAFGDKMFLKSFANTLWFVLMIAPLGIGIPYKLALFLQRFNKRTQSMGRFIIYVPSLTSGLILALLWRWLLMREGLLNSILVWIGIPAIGWFGEPWAARVGVAMVALSGGGGMFVILFSAVILAIPKELKEAAIIDGATERQYRRMVLRPLLMPTVLLALMLTIVGTIQSWETIYVLFKTGGPFGACATPVYDVFMTAFMYSRANYAAAKGVILMVVIAIVVIIQRRVQAMAGANQ